MQNEGAMVQNPLDKAETCWSCPSRPVPHLLRMLPFVIHVYRFTWAPVRETPHWVLATRRAGQVRGVPSEEIIESKQTL